MNVRPRPWAGFRSVLCPVDFSEHSRLALRYAEAVARRGGAALTIAYANDPLLVAAAAAALHDRALARRSGHELQQFVDATLSPHTHDELRVKPVVAIAEPADLIMKTARRARADLIVIGTHGLTGAGRLLLGSTTLSVLQRARVPVLAVPRPGGPLAADWWRRWPGDPILAAVELDAGSRRDADLAADIAQWFGSALRLLHVVPEMAAPGWLRADLGAHDRIQMENATRQLDAVAARVGKRVKTDTRVLRGAVADEIAALAATERAGLVITALRERRGWLGTRRGSISYHVLSHAIAPVLAVPPTWRRR